MPQFSRVGELVKFLQTLPPDTPIVADGADCGGYDVQACWLLNADYIENYQERVFSYQAGPVLRLMGDEQDKEFTPPALLNNWER